MQTEDNFKKFLVLFTILASADCGDDVSNMSNDPSTDSILSQHHNEIFDFGGKFKESSDPLKTDLVEFENTMMDYLEDILTRKTLNIWPGFSFEIKNETLTNNDSSSRKTFEQRNLNDVGLMSKVSTFLENHTLKIDLSERSTNVGTGRLFFFKGLKKLMWPLFIGLQVVKTVLLVLFLPSIIGSVGKIVGKGLPSLSGTFSQFSQPAAHTEGVDDLDFKDNSFNSENSDSDGTFNSAYQYNIPDSKNNFVSQMYESAQANNANKRIGIEHSKNVNGIMSKRDDFKIFHDIPSSSLLLSNYDPFYSPLLSRLDAIFQQLGLAKSSDESCREKLVCLMYSNPAKYAPYSNLVSAQLSRELNELRKPTSDNPDILRFFKYMRAAKDGQDGIDCEISYKECSSFSDMSGPAMINTFNDINKLVQARKLKK